MITVFTPTYNRIQTLPKLYESLLKQTFKDFEWLIVDDGSSDNTAELVNDWKKARLLNITYFKKENGGKHRAINKGLELAKGELFFIVDSDDYLLNNSLLLINKHYQDIKDNSEIIGVTGFRCYPDGKIIGGKMFPNSVTDSNLIERRSKYKVKADMAHVLKTEIFRKFLFPEVQGEKFVAESIVWNRMSMQYKMRYFNEPIYVGEYLDGGLSNNSIKNRRKNNLYATLLYKELVSNPIADPIVKLKAAINYWRFAFCKSKNIFSLFFELKNFHYSIMAFPIGFILYIRDSLNNNINVKSLNNER